MSARGGLVALALLAAMPAGAAEIPLPGAQHFGDGDDPLLVPSDPVTRAQMQAYPMHFHLTQPSTITAVRLDGAVDLDDRFRVYIDDLATPLAGTLAGDVYTLAAPLALGAGTHVLRPDGGCTPSGFAEPCLAGENDFAVSGFTLIATAPTASRSNHRHRHLGTVPELDNDFTGFYPDLPDGISIDIPFTLEIPRVLAEVRFYHLRDVSALGPSQPRVLLDGAPLGTLTADGNPFLLPGGALLAAGPHTLTVRTGTISDDVSWDDVVLIFTNDPATTPGAFNAVDPGESPATGPLRTRVAGSPMTVDLVALLAGAPLPAYTGSVTVTLVDASNALAGCEGWPAAQLLGTVAFGTSDAGRRSFTATPAVLLREARLRMYDAALGIASCSADTFAVRPDRFEGLVASHGDERSAGTVEPLASGAINPATLPRHRAGQPFTLSAIARLGDGGLATSYSGSPTVRVLASALGDFAGTLSADTWAVSGGSLRSDLARYDEAGAVTIRLEDTTFAATDADDTAEADLRIASVPLTLGRFVPDHFVLEAETPATAPALLAACGAFTYVGQPLAFTPSPPRLAIKAVTAAGAVTRNYDGALYHLPAAIGAATTFPAAAGTVLAVGAPSPDNTLTNLGDGVTRFELRFNSIAFARGAPVPPFLADVALQPGAFTEADGTVIEPAPGQYGAAAPALGIPVIGGGLNPREIRYGRLAVENAHGSERLPLDVPLRAEYWAAGGGFATNTADSCTTVPAANVSVALGPMAGTVQSYTPGLVLGQTALRLAAPDTPGQVWVQPDLGAAGLPWLMGDTDSDGAWDDSPRGIVTFGIARNSQKRIYQREVVR